MLRKLNNLNILDVIECTYINACVNIKKEKVLPSLAVKGER